MNRRRRLALLLATMALTVGAVAAGCGDDDDDSSSAGGGSDLSGTIIIDGSSTVFPLSRAAAEGFNAENSGVQIDVRESGTSGGFEVFCKGETDISDASREIDEEEVAACEAGGVTYQELRVGSDGITVVTGADADVGGDNLTLDQLKAVWAPKSTIKNWDRIPPPGSFNDLALTLAGPGSQSGTYDFFNEEVLGEDAAGEVIQPRQDYAASEDDNQTIRTVTSVPGGMGYFGYSYYNENQDALKAFSLDGIAPTPETITDGSYPLARPLYIYVSDASLEKPEVAAFARYYLENAVRLSEEQGFVPAPQDALDEALAKLPAAE
jgi:phosphate transport system substrate-binding protein